MILRIGSRDSELAKIQAESVVERIEENTNHHVDHTTSTSLGDRNTEQNIQELGETGVFTGELDSGVLNGSLDAAVHSLKDCPTNSDEELVIGAILPRTTPFDVLIGLERKPLTDLEPGTVIGTSSQRRRANVLNANPSVQVEPCRGNVPTRLEKLEDESSPYDGLILASAGLERLDIQTSGRLLSQEEMLPAPGQGAIAVTCHRDKNEVRDVLKQIDHGASRAICEAERSMLNRLEGGCQAPIGALGKTQDGKLQLKGSVCGVNGERKISHSREGERSSPEKLGIELAEVLLNQGAEELIPRDE